MPIIWRNGMSVGNDHIDHDHHFMINFINTIELVLQTPEQKEMLIEVLNQLLDYAVKHFRREESIQRKIEFPNSVQHKNSHTSLLKDLNDLITRIKNTKSEKEIADQATEIVNFLRNWLINHVLKEDMLFKPHLAKHPRGFS